MGTEYLEFFCFLWALGRTLLNSLLGSGKYFITSCAIFKMAHRARTLKTFTVHVPSPVLHAGVPRTRSPG